MWYLIVSFPDLCRLSYLYVFLHVAFVVFVPMSRLFRRTCARDALALLCLCVACWFSACGILGWLRLCIVVLVVFVRVDCWFCCVYVCVLFVWSCLCLCLVGLAVFVHVSCFFFVFVFCVVF